jgi:hypothetical protein
MATNTPREGYNTFLRLVLTRPEVPHGYQLEVRRVYHPAYLHDAWCCTNYGDQRLTVTVTPWLQVMCSRRRSRSLGYLGIP